MSIVKIAELNRKLEFYKNIRQMYKNAKLGFEIAITLENNKDTISDLHDFAYDDLISYAKERKRHSIKGDGHGDQLFIKKLLRELRTLETEIDYETFKIEEYEYEHI